MPAALYSYLSPCPSLQRSPTGQQRLRHRASNAQMQARMRRTSPRCCAVALWRRDYTLLCGGLHQAIDLIVFWFPFANSGLLRLCSVLPDLGGHCLHPLAFTSSRLACGEIWAFFLNLLWRTDPLAAAQRRLVVAWCLPCVYSRWPSLHTNLTSALLLVMPAMQDSTGKLAEHSASVERDACGRWCIVVELE